MRKDFAHSTIITQYYGKLERSAAKHNMEQELLLARKRVKMLTNAVVQALDAFGDVVAATLHGS